MSNRVAAVVLLVAGVAVGYTVWTGYRKATGAVDSIGNLIGGAYDAVTDVLSSGAAAIAAVPESVVNFVHGPPVPSGSQSVQRRSATDLPEGSYQAAAMFWSLYPDAVFYD